MSFIFFKIRLFSFIVVEFYFLSSFSIEVDKGKYQAHWAETDSLFPEVYLSQCKDKINPSYLKIVEVIIP